LNFDTVVLDLLLDLNPNYNQGELSLLKSAITCNDTFAVIAVRTGLHLLFQHKLPAKQIVELQSFVAHQTKNNHLFFHEKVSKLAIIKKQTKSN
jgi:dsRNA-specific ribonuclease